MYTYVNQELASISEEVDEIENELEDYELLTVEMGRIYLE